MLAIISYVAVATAQQAWCPRGGYYNRSGSQILPRELVHRLLAGWHRELAARNFVRSGSASAPLDRVLTHEDDAWPKAPRCLSSPYIEPGGKLALGGQINEQAFKWQLGADYKALARAVASAPDQQFSLPPGVGVWSDLAIPGAQCNGTEEFISDSYRFIFRNMPKAGTNSLVHYFKCNLGMKRTACQHIPEWKKREYLHVSSTRSPISRFVSAYNEVRLVHAAHFPSTLAGCSAPWRTGATMEADWTRLRAAMRKKTGNEKWLHGWWGSMRTAGRSC